jgi:hypothetical protein
VRPLHERPGRDMPVTHVPSVGQSTPDVFTPSAETHGSLDTELVSLGVGHDRAWVIVEDDRTE